MVYKRARLSIAEAIEAGSLDLSHKRHIYYT